MDAAEQATRRALRTTRNNVKEAAALLGISRQALYGRMRRFGIKIELTQERIRERSLRANEVRWARVRGAA
jgi:DNA-binding NtrC family response regulator